MATLKQKIENLTWADLVKKLKEILTNFNSKFEGLTGRVSILESSSGGGGSQDLQSVLNNGNKAIDAGIILEHSTGAQTVYLNNNGFIFANPSGGTNTNMIFASPLGSETITIPNKTGTLATLQDIPSSTVGTLEQVLTAGNVTTKVMIFQTSGGITNSIIDYNGIAVDNTTEQARISLDATDPQIRIEDLTSGASIATRKDRITLSKGSFNTHLTVDTPIGNTFINMPMKSGGTHTLATLEDINAVGSLIPTYADNSAAVTGGLAVNRLYKTPSGDIKVRV